MSEADEQATLVEWLEWKRIPAYHVPNEAKRGPKAQREFKRLGGKPGVPDLCIPVARGGYHGMYIEMKFGRNKPTPQQDAWLALLSEQGYKTVVCWSADQAMSAVRNYMARA